MPILIPVLAGVASFFGGAYIGTVVQNATEAPSVAISSATVQENKKLSNRDFLIAGGLGVVAYFLYRWIKKRG